jgi:hypothetical protein
MSLEDVNILDNIGIDKESGHVVLSIIDNLEWNDEYKHLSLLQEKLNYYLGFIESDEIYSVYPKAIGRNFEIFLYLKYRIPENGIEFLNRVKGLFEQSGYFLRAEEWVSETENWKVIF